MSPAELITPEKIDEWLKEIEARPESAPLVIRAIADRLRELARRDETLQAENIALRAGRKVEEYERRIASLERQLELLKRRYGEAALAGLEDSLEPAGGSAGEAAAISLAPVQAASASLFIYNPAGQVLRLELPLESLVSGAAVGKLLPDGILPGHPPGLLFTNSQEELLLVFDTGRSVAVSAQTIPAATGEGLSWAAAYVQEPLGREELVLIVPIARLALHDVCVQASRRGFVRSMPEAVFEDHLARNFVGSGVRLKADRICNLVFCYAQERLALVTYEGLVTSVEIKRLPVAPEEALRLSNTDHIVAAFALGRKPYLLAVTQVGKILQRQAEWIETAATPRAMGQGLYSKERRESGVRVVGSALVAAGDWGVALRSDGRLVTCLMGDLFNTGNLLSPSLSPADLPTPAEQPLEILAFAVLE